MASCVDEAASKVQTAVALNEHMSERNKALGQAPAATDHSSVSVMIERFKKQMKNLDEVTSVMKGALSSATMSTTHQEQGEKGGQSILDPASASSVGEGSGFSLEDRLTGTKLLRTRRKEPPQGRYLLYCPSFLRTVWAGSQSHTTQYI